MIDSPSVPAPGSRVRISMPAAVEAILGDVATHEVVGSLDSEGYVAIRPILDRWLRVPVVAREVARCAASGEPAPAPRASRIRPARLVVAS